MHDFLCLRAVSADFIRRRVIHTEIEDNAQFLGKMIFQSRGSRPSVRLTQTQAALLHAASASIGQKSHALCPSAHSAASAERDHAHAVCSEAYLRRRVCQSETFDC
jgi:hypothetical protein